MVASAKRGDADGYAMYSPSQFDGAPDAPSDRQERPVDAMQLADERIADQ